MQLPTRGRVVIYNTTEEELRGNASSNSCNVQKQLPATIVCVWSDDEDASVNLKVQYDGSLADLWKTSAPRGNEPGQWNWPERV